MIQLIIEKDPFTDDSIGIFMRYSCLKIMSVFHITLRPCESKFQYFLNQNSNVYLEKDERQALRTRKRYIQILFDDSIGIFMRYPCLKSGQLQRPTY